MTQSLANTAPATGQAGCIEWAGPRDKDGYGKTWWQGRHARAHRVAYCKAHGLDLANIDGQLVLHSCDNPSCVNPQHLRTGTSEDNAQDKVNRGRAPKTAPFSRNLDDATAAAIRNEYIPSVGNRPNPNGYAGLGRKYNLSPQAVKQIVLGNTYHTRITNEPI